MADDDPIVAAARYIAAGGVLAGTGAAVRHWGPKVLAHLFRRQASDAAVAKVEAEADLIRAEIQKTALGLAKAELDDIREAMDRIKEEARQTRAEAEAATERCRVLGLEHAACEVQLAGLRAEADALRAHFERLAASGDAPPYVPADLRRLPPPGEKP